MTKINATIRKLVGEKSIKKIKSQQEAFTCLKSTEEAILINNPKEFQLTILQTNQQDHFYLGFDDQEEIESKGIISVNRHIGSNTLGLSASTIAILKNLEMVNNFLQSWFDNPKSNFFDFEGLKQKQCKTLTATAVIGLYKGYSDELISVIEFKDALLKAQQEVKENQGVLLSIKTTQCEILFLGQEEPSVTLDFIQYPKFLYEEEKWRSGVISFVETMMKKLEQNRTVIVFTDTTLMLENSNKIDSKINIHE